MIRARIASAVLARLDERAEPLTAEAVARPAVVLAPHPDDESLGCGGLVALKRELGVPVTVVFMTDGSWSHAAFVEPAVLADRRRREARAACARLGVAADEVHFLDFRDGNLAAHVDEAVARLDPILRSARATQVILPHPAERPSDHAATFFVAEHCVAQRLRTDYDALLYPVWLWDQWPFTNPWSAPRARTTTRAAVRTAVEHRLGLGLARSLRWRVDITPVLGRKQAALDAHTSQMVRPPDAPDWLILADVSGGDWLDLLVRPVELYGAVALRGARPAGTRAGGAP